MKMQLKSKTRFSVMRASSVALAASITMTSMPAHATLKQQLQVGMLAAAGWTGAYGFGQVLGHFQRTDWAGLGVGLLASAACAIPAGMLSWYSTPELLGGGLGERTVNAAHWTPAGMTTVMFKFFSVGFVGGLCGFAAKGVYNNFRDFGWMGQHMKQPVTAAFQCPAGWTCEPTNPAPPPARRKLFEAAAEAQIATDQSQQYPIWKRANYDEQEMEYAQNMLRVGCTQNGNKNVEQCRQLARQLYDEYLGAQKLEASNWMANQRDVAETAHVYASRMGEPEFPLGTR